MYFFENLPGGGTEAPQSDHAHSKPGMEPTQAHPQG